MGYRAQQNWEEEEERRYRAEVPRHIRAWYAFRGCSILFGPVIVALIIGWAFRHW